MTKFTSFDLKIGSLFRQCRFVTNQTQQEIADKLGICKSAYSNIEAGKTSITLIRFCEICGILELDPTEAFRKLMV